MNYTYKTLLSIDFRGQVLERMAALEKTMDTLLCVHFTHDEDKIEDLLLGVFGGLRITFENKRGILDYLYRNNRRKFFEGNDLTLFSKMQKLFSTRTILAHYILDNSEYLDEDTLRYISLNNKHEYKVFTKQDRDDFVTLYKEVSLGLFSELVGALPSSELQTLQSLVSMGDKLS